MRETPATLGAASLGKMDGAGVGAADTEGVEQGCKSEDPRRPLYLLPIPNTHTSLQPAR